MDTGFKAATTIENAGSWTSLTAGQINSSNNTRAVLSWANTPGAFTISDFAFGIPVGATILGIEVIVEYRSDGGSGGETVRMDVQLSWNNGSNFTSAIQGDNHGTTEVQKTYGGSTELWGRSWSQSEFADGTFMLRATAQKQGTFPNAEVDYVAVKVYYLTEVDVTDERGAKIRGRGDIYSREARATLPTNTDPLSTIYDSGDLDDVSADDGTRVDLEGKQNYLIHNFTRFNSNEDNTNHINATINLQCSVAPSTTAVILQIYNFDTDSWETVDTESSASADTDFDLTANITTNTENYYDSDFMSHFRVVQDFS